MARVSPLSARPYTFAVISHEHALRAVSALCGYPVNVATIVAFGFLAHCNDTGVKCGFMMLFDALRQSGKTRSLGQLHIMVEGWQAVGLVERGRNLNRYANLSLKLTPSGRLLLYRFEALLQKEAEKGMQAQDPGSQC